VSRRRGSRRRGDRSRAGALGFAGWIFADLTLALLIVFMVSTPEDLVSAGPNPNPTPTVSPKPTLTTKPTPKPTPTRRPTPSPTPNYSIRPLDQKIVILDPVPADFAGIHRRDTGAQEAFLSAFDQALRQQAAGDPSLLNRPAGFVLVYGYAPLQNLGVGKQAAADVYGLLVDRRPQFRQARTTPDAGNWYGGSTGQIRIYAWFYV
jgi:hypothetical protein